MTTFHFISLGCPKNRVDSEVVVAGLLARGFQVCQDPEQAEVIVVNTCSFIRPAVDEAIDTLLAAAALKDQGKTRYVAALGCLPQRYGPQLARELDEVDLFVTAAAADQAAQEIAALVEHGQVGRFVQSQARFLHRCGIDRALTTPPGTAYVKIAEGCPNRCAYCTIPDIRGPQQSRSVEDIVAELGLLAREGVVEANLVAQDLTAYGRDLKPKTDLVALLRAIQEADQGPQWVRLLYLNPGLMTGELLDLVAGSARILPYLDIPLQHSQPRLIRAMNRRPPGEDTLAWLESIRKMVPGVVLRTSLMVGYPGETEEDFKAMLDFMAQTRFDNLGAFAFCPEEGTKAADMDGQVPEEVALERLDRLLDLQQGISLAINQARVGQEVEVLVEGLHPESDLLLTSRAWFQAPEVDGTTIIRAGQGEPGRIQKARIVEAEVYDLVAELVEEEDLGE